MTHLWTRTAIIVAAAAAIGACTTAQYPTVEGQTPREPLVAAKPNYPIVQSDAPPQAAPTSYAPAAAPSGAAVQSQALPPVTNTAPPPAPVAAQALPAVQYARATPPPPPPPPVTRTVTVAGGKVVDTPGKPSSYVVEQGDTLYAISRKLGTTVERLAADNNLSSPYTLSPGQVLKGPAPAAKAYVVEPGDTLYAIGRRFSVSPDQIAQASGITLTTPIEIGQKLILPTGYRDAGPTTRTITAAAPSQAPTSYPRPVTSTPLPGSATAAVVQSQTTPPPPPAPALPSRPQPYTPSPGVVIPPKPASMPPSAPPTAASTLSSEDAAVAAAGRGRFTWPVRGEVISTFGPKSGGQRNDGINISAPENLEVRAAAGGEVVYAGDQVPGFGNLVLIKHEGGWITAYAHLGRVDVKMQDVVQQGQQLGLVGSTGGVGDPQLHFEVRYGPSVDEKPRPIDPTLVLP